MRVIMYNFVHNILTRRYHYGRAESILPPNAVFVFFHFLFDTFPQDVKCNVVGQSIAHVYGQREKELDYLRESA